MPITRLAINKLALCFDILKNRRQISVNELPLKLRQAVQRYFKRNPREASAANDVKFGLEGRTWIACDSQGRRGFGANPVVAVRRLNKTRWSLLEHLGGGQPD